MPSPWRVFSLLRMLAELHVAADRHEVDQILGQQIEPFAEFPLIQKIGFLYRNSSTSCFRANHAVRDVSFRRPLGI